MKTSKTSKTPKGVDRDVWAALMTVYTLWGDPQALDGTETVAEVRATGLTDCGMTAPRA